MRRITKLIYQAEKLLPVVRLDPEVIIIQWDDIKKEFVTPEITYLDDVTRRETVLPPQRYKTPEAALAALNGLLVEQSLDGHIIINDTKYIREVLGKWK